MIQPEEVEFTIATTLQDLGGIVQLSKKNLMANLSAQERKNSGFVLTPLSLELVQKIHNLPIQSWFVIGKLKKTNKVISYLIFIDKKTMYLVEELKELRKSFQKIKYKGSYISEYQYIYAVQLALQKEYRKSFILPYMIFYINHLLQKKNVDFCVAAIAKQNRISLEALKKGGCVTVGSSTYLFSNKMVQCQIIMGQKGTTPQNRILAKPRL